MPAMVMVDLDLERSEGCEALAWIRHHAGLRYLPVVAMKPVEEPDG
jgi:hypothetical protein